jgi:hypothetical protein
MEKRNRMRRWVVAMALGAVLTASSARAEGSYANDAGMGVACVFVNVLYMPAKIVYATLGGLTGGFAYLLTGLYYDVADRIWAPSLGGNYVVTPAHLRNEQTLYFSGTIEEPAAGGIQESPAE